MHTHDKKTFMKSPTMKPLLTVCEVMYDNYKIQRRN